MRNRAHFIVSVITWLSLFTSVFLSISNATTSKDPLKTSSLDTSTETVLTIEGKLKGNTPVSFDLNSLLQLPKTSFEISHPVSGEKNKYTGILLADFLNYVEIADDAKYLVIRASNDYQAAVKINDINSYDYLLSYTKNGQFYDQLPVAENRGPLAITINFDKHQKLDYDIYKHQLVWFVENITVK